MKDVKAVLWLDMCKGLYNDYIHICGLFHLWSSCIQNVMQINHLIVQPPRPKNCVASSLHMSIRKVIVTEFSNSISTFNCHYRLLQQAVRRKMLILLLHPINMQTVYLQVTIWFQFVNTFKHHIKIFCVSCKVTVRKE